MIDYDSPPGSYALYFERAPDFVRHCYLVRARCYRDRKAHDKLIATTNEIRAKHGMEPL